MKDAVKRAGIVGAGSIVGTTLAFVVGVLAWIDGRYDARYASHEDVAVMRTDFDHAAETMERLDGKLDRIAALLMRPPGAPPNAPTPGERADEAERKLDEILRRLECERRGDCDEPVPEPEEEPKR